MKKRRLLVVDDELALCKVIQIALETLGQWIVSTANSGKEALNKALEEQPDAILLDMMLSDVNGLIVLKQLYNNPNTKNIPVIILSADLGHYHDDEYLQGNIAGMISKPIEPFHLAEKIENILSEQEWSKNLGKKDLIKSENENK